MKPTGHQPVGFFLGTPLMPRYHVVYHGRVQGVGFRATARRIAASHPVTGYVANQPDGTVELEVQGDKAAIDRFLNDVQRQFFGFVTDEERQAVAEVDGDASFAVRY